MDPLSLPTFLLAIRAPRGASLLTPDQQAAMLTKCLAWIRTARDRGAYVSGDPLADTGRVVHGPVGTTVTDGPFAEIKEEICGYLLLRAPDLESATNLAQSFPGLAGASSIEVRPINLLPL